MRDLSCVEDEDDEDRDEVEDRHERSQLRRPLTDLLDPAEDDQSGDGGDDRADEPEFVGEEARLAAGGLDDDRGRLVRLEQVAGTDDAEHGGECVEAGEELPELGSADLGQPCPQVVHGPARDGAVVVDLPVFHAERRLGHLHRHGEEAEDDDPQGGAGPADGDRHGDTGDIAQSDGAREFGGERLEARDLARVGLAGEAAADDADGVSESGDRLEAKVEGEEDGGGHEPHDDEGDAERADLQLEEDDVAEGLGRGSEEGFDGLVDSGGGEVGLSGGLGEMFSY